MSNLICQDLSSKHFNSNGYAINRSLHDSCLLSRRLVINHMKKLSWNSICDFYSSLCWNFYTVILYSIKHTLNNFVCTSFNRKEYIFMFSYLKTYNINYYHTIHKIVAFIMDIFTYSYLDVGKRDVFICPYSYQLLFIWKLKLILYSKASR